VTEIKTCDGPGPLHARDRQLIWTKPGGAARKTPARAGRCPARIHRAIVRTPMIGIRIIRVAAASRHR